MFDYQSCIQMAILVRYFLAVNFSIEKNVKVLSIGCFCCPNITHTPGMVMAFDDHAVPLTLFPIFLEDVF
jgi:hypothetical protein